MNFAQLGQAVIETEAQAVMDLSHKIGDDFNLACQYLLGCSGRIVVLGMGKSGHIGGKIAATLASTGSPAFFIHPGEASHGDLGMITKQDVVLAISNSGNTQEILTLLPLIKRLNVPLISLTGNQKSTIAIEATVNLDVSIQHEACPLGLAPTTSTTVALVMGDALAIALLEARGFTVEDFAMSHPGGTLGRRLLLKVDDCCHRREQLPLVTNSATISEALIEVTDKKLGMTCVVDKKGGLLGVFTDGDIRRALSRDIDIHTTPLTDVMTTNCHTIKLGILAAEALDLMERHKITSLVIIDDKNYPVGVVHLHGLLSSGVL